MRSNISPLLVALVLAGGPGRALAADFDRDVRPILERCCLGCHGPVRQKSGYRLDDREAAFRGGDRGEAAIVAGRPDESLLWAALTGGRDVPLMPPKESEAPRPTEAELGTIRAWIEQGAPWPEAPRAVTTAEARTGWAWRPIARPSIPPSKHANPIDAFLAARLAEKRLAMSAQADRRTLLRRVSFDLTGLPPTYEEVVEFQGDRRPDAYERVVDRLLSSPRYGERWARHWLDVVHFGETHGYDKDKPRPNAWPYRDYVIRAFNEDRPYPRFVQEQVAGDVLFPDTADGCEALGFIAAGPWDFIGHAEVPESKVDGKIARHLDRDDMVSNTMSTFCSVTVHCAQCHDHKFDPISQEDYYSLQAVFAALDRADRPYDRDPSLARRRRDLETRRDAARAVVDRIAALARDAGGAELAALESRLGAARKTASGDRRPEYGWHSGIAASESEAKWVQVDLGREVEIHRIVLAPCEDDFNNIGAGFGFPRRYRIEAGLDPAFVRGAAILVSREEADEPNPRSLPVHHAVRPTRARFVRVTATRLAPRQQDFIFALAELQVLDGSGGNAAIGAQVSSLDSIEAPARWSRRNLTDGIYPAAIAGDVAALEAERDRLLSRVLTHEMREARARAVADLSAIQADLDRLPPQGYVYAGTVHHGSGAFVGTGPSGGRPRPIAILPRGDVKKPGRVVGPGSLSAVTQLKSRFDIPPDGPEGERRAALARWLTDRDNPLPWRSIVNRVWQYHFGRGLVDTPNDFGRMGGTPSHPELLEWLAAWFRDDAHGSLKSLHRLIVTSASYRQRSDVNDPRAAEIDGENRLLWRMSRRKLEAEAIRDEVLAVAGKLDLGTLGGPGYRDFVIEHPEHSPHYQFHLADPDDHALHRRSIYRFIVRSQQQPWMAAMDCADPSLLVDRRNQTITPLQALAQLNDALIVAMSRHFADRVRGAGEVEAQVGLAFRLAIQRQPDPEELAELAGYVRRRGLENGCRLLLNLNEFHFAD
ncbi:Planctomycete cytochrome C [Aquisphaera giovannonii]|uniref:Planctomycete cytochrome C n=1 Tax=Aquisphaera giovannonii TaxID=406548 RepID=A0A5B9W0M2_9BACT|nr:DUF1549 domain-containing protein [Aquisphaera giovannonii]QEH33505.1 Planctomycete cytochrome C [Aquisphaera giovannonii]